MDKQLTADWNFDTCTCSGVIRWNDGAEVFMQGEEASTFDDEIEACETAEQVDALLDNYRHIAE